jgi:hypothetical protein
MTAILLAFGARDAVCYFSCKDWNDMDIEGTWWNELGSQMDIVPDNADPRGFKGTYHTNVGDAQEKSYPIVGRYDDYGQSDQTIGWIVAFDPPDPAKEGDPPNKPSLTAWSGQVHEVDFQGRTVVFIATTWILTRMTDPGDDWRSTLVNRDYFFRNRPSSDQIELARRYGKTARFFIPETAFSE